MSTLDSKDKKTSSESASNSSVGFGRIILTAADSTQYAWEGDAIKDGFEGSFFTHYLVEGLRTGEADRDGDGLITIDELYDYVYEHIVATNARQTPTKFSSNQRGEIVIAKNPRSGIHKPVALPSHLVEAIEDSRTYVREGAVRDLGRILMGKNPGLALAAREALQRISVDDDSRRVSEMAANILNDASVIQRSVVPAIIYHPLLLSELQPFFIAAGFQVTLLDDKPDVFLCYPILDVWHHQFREAVYGRVVSDRTLDRDIIVTIYEEALKLVRRPKVILVIVDRTPTISGWIEIGALRAQYDVQIVPIDDSLIRSGRERQKERETLEIQLRRFLGGRRDLFDIKHPVADRLSFFGREARAAEFLQLLTHGQPIALFGLRKMGKSSLMQFLLNQAVFPVAHVDLQAGVELNDLYQRILASLMRSVRVKAEDLDWQIPQLSGDASSAFVTVIKDLMKKLDAHGKDPRLGLFIDEIEIISPQAQLSTGVIDLNTLTRYLLFSRTIRGLVQEQAPNFSILLTGVDAHINRISRWTGQQNPFYQFFREEYLGPLNRDDCVLMVRSIGSQMGLTIDDNAALLVFDNTGGHPFLARQLCSTAYRLHNDNAGNTIGEKEVQNAVDLFIRDPNTAALLGEGGLWGEITDPHLWSSTQITENTAILISLATNGPQSEKMLLAKAKDERACEESLFELKQRAILGTLKGNLYIQFGLFQKWIHRYAIVRK
jgi:hypothetical protein